MEYVPKRIDLFDLIPHGSFVAEIGVRRGEFSVELMEHPNIAKLFLVDAWRQQIWSAEQQPDDEHEQNYRTCLFNLRGHIPGGRVEIIRSLSTDAAGNQRIPDLDAVYLDGAHDYENVLQDLRVWSHRLKPDGVLMGHDFTRNEIAHQLGFGVVEAVHDFCLAHGWRIANLSQEEFPSYRLVRGVEER